MKKVFLKQNKGFTLAEMMLVLMIISTVILAIIPVGSKISPKLSLTDNSTPWKYSIADSSFIYYPNKVYIGDNYRGSDATLNIITKFSSNINYNTYQSPIRIFTPRGSELGQIAVSQNNIYLGSGKNNLTASAATSDTNFYQNVGIGHNVFSGTTGSGAYPTNYNVAIGTNALRHINSYSTSQISNNVALGYNSLGWDYTGAAIRVENNVAIGSHSLRDGNLNKFVTVDDKNKDGIVSIGHYAGNHSYNNSGSVYIGPFAGQYSFGNPASATSLANVFIGFVAGGNYDPFNSRRKLNSNVAIGTYALAEITSSTYTMRDNVAIGYAALQNIQGSYNVGLGAYAGSGLTASSKTCIGSFSCPSFAEAAGWNPNASSNQVYIGQALASNPDDPTNRTRSAIFKSTTLYGPASGLQAGSDRRLKNVFGTYKLPLEDYRKIKVYNYTLKADKEKNPKVGVLAQEVKSILKYSVDKDPNGFYSFNLSELTFASVNAIQEIDKNLQIVIKKCSEHFLKIKNLEKRVLKLKSDIISLNQNNANLKKELTEINARIEKLQKE